MKYAVIFTLYGAALSLLYGCRTASDLSSHPPAGTVQGRVLWNKQPVSGAIVYATSEYNFDSIRYGSATTGVDGAYSISGVPAGSKYLYVFGNRDEYWVSAVTPFQMPAETGIIADDSHLCKGFTPISPKTNEQVGSRPLLKWAPYPDAFGYALRILPKGQDKYIYSCGDRDAHITTTEIYVDMDLPAGEYLWRVDAFNANGHIIGCSYWPATFVVVAH